MEKCQDFAFLQRTITRCNNDWGDPQNACRQLVTLWQCCHPPAYEAFWTIIKSIIAYERHWLKTIRECLRIHFSFEHLQEANKLFGHFTCKPKNPLSNTKMTTTLTLRFRLKIRWALCNKLKTVFSWINLRLFLAKN